MVNQNFNFDTTKFIKVNFMTIAFYVLLIFFSPIDTNIAY